MYVSGTVFHLRNAMQIQSVVFKLESQRDLQSFVDFLIYLIFQIFERRTTWVILIAMAEQYAMPNMTNIVIAVVRYALSQVLLVHFATAFANYKYHIIELIASQAKALNHNWIRSRSLNTHQKFDLNTLKYLIR